MRPRIRIALASLALSLVSTLLVGCGSSTVKIGWREFSGSKWKRANYVTFDGVQSKAFHVEAGQTIELACDVKVEKGALNVQLVAPDGETLWKETFREDREAFTNVTATEEGLHSLRLEGEKAGGGFDISWNVTS